MLPFFAIPQAMPQKIVPLLLVSEICAFLPIQTLERHHFTSTTFAEVFKRRYGALVKRNRQLTLAVLVLCVVNVLLVISLVDCNRKLVECNRRSHPLPLVNARHCLCADEKDAWKAVVQLEFGYSFDEVVKKHSNDMYTREHRGMLGWMRRAQMEAEFGAQFADTAFALRKGYFSRVPVKSPFGFHIIFIDDNNFSN